MLPTKRIELNGEFIEIPKQGILDHLTRVDELLIANLSLIKALGAALQVQLGPSSLVGLPLDEQRKKAESGQWVPYTVRSFALDTARADVPVVVEGDFLHAWTDGALSGIGVKYNNQNNDLIYFQRRNPIYGFKFWKLFLTHEAQAGKTLDLLVGREASAYAETYSVELENKVSAILDSTSTPLGIAATYTGAAFSVEAYGKIIGVCFADQNGTLYVDQMSDGTNWDSRETMAYVAGDAMGFVVEVMGNKARIVFTNGAVAQTAFRLQARARRV
jgi:hypothetical protein